MKYLYNIDLLELFLGYIENSKRLNEDLSPCIPIKLIKESNYSSDFLKAFKKGCNLENIEQYKKAPFYDDLLKIINLIKDAKI